MNRSVMSNDYWVKIWRSRFFWIHLVFSDLRSRWRRSFFGMAWAIIQPLGLTLLMSFVFSKLFHSDIGTYAPYIFSGVIIWDYILTSVTGGALSFVQAEAYIKQCRHPLAIYTLRTVLVGLMILAFAIIALFVWAAVVFPEHIGWHWLAVLSIFPILVLITWPFATLLSYIGARFRDLPHVMGLIMQALWFMSPVYFQAKMFRGGGLDLLIDFNPVYHILQIVRAPLLEGKWPTAANYGYALIPACVFAFLAWLVGRKFEKRVIFYL
ncbi:ABC transporter permease [Candidatus Williamhamiltonella defendens]|uniref:ABC transporter permease n=1 Tax=Candidatus Williamhamiltonella defendens TaxID=138072 RepID=UPI001F259157|nr:ABC transporter permease [Candidatus Hamiltonella defensa]